MANSNGSLIAAIRGPILLITLGVLFAWDYFGRQPFWRTFPVLLILYGFLKLIERLRAGRDRPYQGGSL